MVESLAVYVPAVDSELRNRIWPGSGIVGSNVDEAGRLRIDFEGDADIYPTFADRVRRAAERHLHARADGLQGYPTQACAYVSADEVVEVGRWQTASGNLTISKEERLAGWLDDRGGAASTSGD